MLTCHWVPIGNGKLTLWHFPGRDTQVQLGAFGVTRVVTILTEEQGALRVREAMAQLGIAWTWVSIRRGRVLQNDERAQLIATLPTLSAYLDAGDAMLIHCSAGIHRTGTVAFALLRWRGYAEADALDLIGQMRKETREGIQPRYLRFGNEQADTLRNATPENSGS